MSSFGDRLRQLREARGFKKQGDLGAAAGIHQSTISKYEKGDRKPSASHLARMAKALGVSMDDLQSPVEQSVTLLQPASGSIETALQGAISQMGRMLDTLVEEYRELREERREWRAMMDRVLDRIPAAPESVAEVSKLRAERDAALTEIGRLKSELTLPLGPGSGGVKGAAG